MREKNYNLEIIRVLSFVMVILIHVSNYFCRGFGEISQLEYGYSLVWNVLSRVSVPCFFMISGGLLLGREETLQKGMQRAGRFFSVLLFWSFLYYLFNTYVTGQETFTIHNFMEEPAEAHLWYLYVMVPIYLVLPYLQVLMNNLSWQMEKALAILGGVWMVVNYVLYFTKKELYFEIPLLGNRSYLYYFYMGHLLVKYKDRIKGTTGSWLALYGGCSVVTVLVTYFTSAYKGKHFDKFLAYGSPVMLLGALAFFIAWLKWKDGRYVPSEHWRKRIAFLAGASFGIYLVHIFYLDLYKVFITRAGMSPFWAIPVLAVLLLGVSLLTSYVIGKIPFLKKLI